MRTGCRSAAYTLAPSAAISTSCPCRCAEPAPSPRALLSPVYHVIFAPVRQQRGGELEEDSRCAMPPAAGPRNRRVRAHLQAWQPRGPCPIAPGAAARPTHCCLRLGEGGAGTMCTCHCKMRSLCCHVPVSRLTFRLWCFSRGVRARGWAADPVAA